MKIRNGFVSNSSSSSFIINREDLSTWEYDTIKHHIEYSKELDKINNNEQSFYADESEAWYITEENGKIKGSTGMDNFDMCKFLRSIGVNMDVIEWTEEG